MRIEELTSFSDCDLACVDALMHELGERSSCSEERLRAVVENPDSHLLVLRADPADGADGPFAGCGCLCVARTPEKVIGFVESVVVSSRFRGCGLGRLLMKALIIRARELGVDELHLTSRPSRVAANALYRSLGFTPHETNVYVMDMESADSNIVFATFE